MVVVSSIYLDQVRVDDFLCLLICFLSLDKMTGALNCVDYDGMEETLEQKQRIPLFSGCKMSLTSKM
jgi:hypothetical protein